MLGDETQEKRETVSELMRKADRLLLSERRLQRSTPWFLLPGLTNAAIAKRRTSSTLMKRDFEARDAASGGTSSHLSGNGPFPDHSGVYSRCLLS